jgi:hypothetical protein
MLDSEEFQRKLHKFLFCKECGFSALDGGVGKENGSIINPC